MGKATVLVKPQEWDNSLGFDKESIKLSNCVQGWAYEF
jgi:hypothetical protein